MLYFHIRRLVVMLYNPTDTKYWFDKPLIYSKHAMKRCNEREIEPLDFLPLSSKLSDCTRDGKGNPVRVTFKVLDANPYYVSITHKGVVTTVFRKISKKSAVHYNNLARKKKQYIEVYNKMFGGADHHMIPAHYRERYW